MVTEEMSFKDISYLKLWQWSGTILCNFDRWYQEEQFCELILNLIHWFRRCHLKNFMSGAILKEDITGSIHM